MPIAMLKFFVRPTQVLIVFGLKILVQAQTPEPKHTAIDEDGNIVPDRRDGRADVSLSVPPSLLLEAWGGWSYPFRWLPKDALDPIDPKVDQLSYAYVRPNVRLLSSWKVNQAELRLDVYPVSYLGATVGSVVTQTNLESLPKFEDWTGYDCGQISCSGWNTIPFAEFKFKWVLPSKFFGVLFYRRDWASTDENSKNLTFDPSTALPFRSSGDKTDHLWILVGRPVSRRASLAFRYRDIMWQNAGTRRQDLSGVYQFKLKGPWSLGFEGRQIFRTRNSDFLSASLRLSYVWRNTPEPENQL